jgi:heme-degrading monooxygenase HmoA
VYSRVTQFEVDVLRVRVEDALAMYRERILPELHEQPGYEGVYVFMSPEGRGMIVSFWDSEEAAAAGAMDGWYAKTLEEHMTLFRSPPGRERYEVLLAETPAATAS